MNLYLNLSLFIILILAIEYYEAVKPRVIHKLDDTALKAGAKITLSCSKVQVPKRRSKSQPAFVVFESVQIIKKTKISIHGEISFDLVCNKDGGDAAPPGAEPDTEKGESGKEATEGEPVATDDKGDTGSKDASADDGRTVHDISGFVPNSPKMMFTCKKVQLPKSRTRKIVLESTVIIKRKIVLITGETAFTLVCTKDATDDKEASSDAS